MMFVYFSKVGFVYLKRFFFKNKLCLWLKWFYQYPIRGEQAGKREKQRKERLVDRINKYKQEKVELKKWSWKIDS